MRSNTGTLQERTDEASSKEAIRTGKINVVCTKSRNLCQRCTRFQMTPLTTHLASMTSWSMLIIPLCAHWESSITNLHDRARFHICYQAIITGFRKQQPRCPGAFPALVSNVRNNGSTCHTADWEVRTPVLCPSYPALPFFLKLLVLSNEQPELLWGSARMSEHLWLY